MDKSIFPSLEDTTHPPLQQYRRAEEFRHTIGSRSTDESELRSYLFSSPQSKKSAPELELPEFRRIPSFERESLSSFLESPTTNDR